MKNGPRLAIDFGTTRTKVAYYDTNREEARLVELGISQREIIPSVFYVPKRDAGEILVGDDAMAQLDVDPAGIVREIKREIDKLGKKRCGAGRLAPTRIELAAELLRMVRRRCEEGVFHGQRIDKCTLTVPVSFTESQRSKLVEAANLAGFTDVRLMDEPTAAARAWVEKEGERFGDHVVVVDIGGGTTDFSVVEWSNNRFAPHSSVLPEGFAQGGNDIDDHACDEILSQQEEDDEESVLRVKDSFLVKLRSIKEQFTRGLKRQSVSAGSATLDIQPSVFRAAETEFVNRLCDELQSFFERCQHGGIESPVVLLVGGASRISGLSDMLNEICPREVFTWESADFATVLGAVEYPGNETGFESAKQRKAQASYIEALKAAIADDVVTPSEYDYLISRRQQLGILPEFASTLELNVLGQTLEDTQAKEALSRERIDELIGDGQCEEALRLATEAMIEYPSIDAFELWHYSAEPIAEPDKHIKQARLILSKRKDLWGQCCVVCALSDVGRSNEAKQYFDANVANLDVSCERMSFIVDYANLSARSEDLVESEELASIVSDLLAKRPESTFLTAMYAMSLIGTYPDKSIEIVQHAVNKSPMSVGLRVTSLILEIGTDTLDDAMLKEHCRVLDRISPKHWVSRLARGLQAMRNENYKLAIKEFDGLPEHTSVREVDEMRGLILFFRASCHLELEELAEAKRDVIESVGCGEDSPAFFLHGEFLFQEERYEEARAAYQVALKQDETNIAVLNGLGWANLNLSEFDTGQKYFIDGLKIDVSNIDAQLGSIAAVAYKHFVDDAKLYFFPNIPEDKAANAIQSYAGVQQPIEPWQIVVLYDDTFWGSANDGLCIGCNGVTFKNISESPKHYSFGSIRSVNTESGIFGNKLKINGFENISVTSAGDNNSVTNALSSMLLALAAAGREINGENG